MPGDGKTALASFVGFSNLPNQVHRRSVKKGFQFTMLVLGESGLGKSTFVNTLFGCPIYEPRSPRDPSAETPSEVAIRVQTANIEEKGVRLKVNVLDAPGYGDFVNNEASWKPIVASIDERFDAFLEQERRVNRKNIVDNRIHCCLYFIAPTGHALKTLDIECMKQIHEKVNLIPVIAKADTLTKDETALFKKRILDDLSFHGIKTFAIHVDDDDDKETADTAKELMSKLPFTVMGSEKEVEVDGKKARARQYPWGTILVESEEHSDFVKLRQLLIRSHMEDLISTTNEKLYEAYRAQKLAGANGADSIGNSNSPLSRFEEEKKAAEQRLKKMETDMKAMFAEKVKQKELKLAQNEEKMNKEYAEEKEKLERQKKELEEKLRQLDDAAKAEQAKAAKSKKRSGIF